MLQKKTSCYLPTTGEGTNSRLQQSVSITNVGGLPTADGWGDSPSSVSAMETRVANRPESSRTAALVVLVSAVAVVSFAAGAFTTTAFFGSVESSSRSAELLTQLHQLKIANAALQAELARANTEHGDDAFKSAEATEQAELARSKTEHDGDAFKSIDAREAARRYSMEVGRPSDLGLNRQLGAVNRRLLLTSSQSQPTTDKGDGTSRVRRPGCVVRISYFTVADSR